MFRAKVVQSFSAAHSLRGYQGDCERLHGHNYKVELAVDAPGLDETGIVIDFRDLKGLLKGVLDTLDHAYLNDLEPFRSVNPSAENIARHIYEALSGSMPGEARISEVTVWENDACCVTYTP
jgi:6-pyruvoyltetrahydropterin/6-carboxytetrahydropterin synthase